MDTSGVSNRMLPGARDARRLRFGHQCEAILRKQPPARGNRSRDRRHVRLRPISLSVDAASHLNVPYSACFHSDHVHCFGATVRRLSKLLLERGMRRPDLTVRIVAAFGTLALRKH